jgi:hypothetical protein
MKHSVIDPASAPGSNVCPLFSLEPECLFDCFDGHVHRGHLFYIGFPQQNCHMRSQLHNLNKVKLQSSNILEHNCSSKPKINFLENVPRFPFSVERPGLIETSTSRFL